jgi:hypothetical protein
MNVLRHLPRIYGYRSGRLRRLCADGHMPICAEASHPRAILQSWTREPKWLNEVYSSTKVARSVGVGLGRGDDTRWPCFLTEREALSYMADRLCHTAAFE